MISQLQDAYKELQTKVYWNEELIELLFLSLLVGGHILIEGLPGLGKTLIAKTFSEVLDLDFARIQFTPDLLPNDILGGFIYDQKRWDFILRTWPIFHQCVLIDEINRAPAKVQSGLLEAMAEKQVTIEGETHDLPSPFFVLATQNPRDNEGTYMLPEAQLDRFLLSCVLTYPSPEVEKEIFTQKNILHSKPCKKIMKSSNIGEITSQIENIHVEGEIVQYVLDIVQATRENEKIEIGASTRAGVDIMKASRGYAFFKWRDYVIPEDVKYVTSFVLRHRIVLGTHALVSGETSDQILAEILESVPVSK